MTSHAQYPTEMRPSYLDALRALNVTDILATFDPHVAGTPPLGIDLPSSDIDVLCYAPDPTAFAKVVWDAFQTECNFSLRQWVGNTRPVIATFFAYGWQIEIFGQALPVHDQHGWRHFLIERRLLDLGGDDFREAVIQTRRTGVKTEPAFSQVLGLVGDPYQALLGMADQDDDQLRRLLMLAGFISGKG